jgi:DNA integrity scanning protein DisA with diadenylate cyclase activity
MTPKEYKEMMAHLTRPSRIKVAELDNVNTPDLDQTPDSILKPGETLEDFDVTFRRPNADGGRIGFKRGLDTEAALNRAAYKKIRPITQANIDNYAYFSSIEEAKKSGLKYKVQLPSGPDDAASTITKLFKTKKEAQAAIDAAPITNKDYTEGLIKTKLPKGTVEFDAGRVKIPTGEFIGIGQNRSQIFIVRNKDGSNVKYTAGGAGGKKALFDSVEEVKKAKLESTPDELAKIKQKRIVKNINEITYKNKKTGKIVKKYKPSLGEGKVTIPGQGADTLEEAQKFVDDYFKKNPIIQRPTKELNKKLITLFDDPRIKKILRTGRPSKEDLDIVKDILGGTDRQAQEKLAQLADAVNPKGQRTIEGISKINGKKAKNLFNFYKTRNIAKELEDIAIAKSVGEKRSLGTLRGDIQAEIPMKGGLEGYSVDEAKARASSVRLNSKPYSIFGQVIAGDINQGPKQTFDANLSIFEEQVKNAIKNNEDPTEAIKKYNKRATEAEAEANKYKSRNTKKIYFPKITTDSPDIAIKNKSGYTKYKKYFDKNYAQQGYSFVIPEDLQPLPKLVAELRDKNSSTYKNMIKQLKDVGRKFIKNIDQFDEKELFQKLRNNPNFNTIRKLVPRLASLDFETNRFASADNIMTSGVEYVDDAEKEKNFILRNPFTTAAAGTTAGAIAGVGSKFTKKDPLKGFRRGGKEVLKALTKGAFTPLGVAAATAGFGGIDLTTPAGRIGLGLEAAFAPELVKTSIGATKGIKNRALQKGIQRVLNLGLKTPTALRLARIASPIGIASLGAEGLYQAGKFTKKRIGELRAMTPQQRQDLRAEQSALAFEGAREGGLIGKKSGPPPISGPTPHGDEGLPAAFKRGRNR